MSGTIGYDELRAATVHQVAHLMAAAAITAPASSQSRSPAPRRARVGQRPTERKRSISRTVRVAGCTPSRRVGAMLAENHASCWACEVQISVTCQPPSMGRPRAR